MRAIAGNTTRTRQGQNTIMKQVYAALPFRRGQAITSKTVSINIGMGHSTASGALVKLEEQGYVTKFRQHDTMERPIGAKMKKFKFNNTYYYIGKGNTAMSLNLEGLRKECAKALYESMRAQAAKEGGMIPWHQINADHKRSFEKLAGTVFSVLFRKHPDDLIKFFTDGRAD